VEIVFSGNFVQRPRAAAEKTHPVVRRTAVPARLPYVIIAVRAVFIAAPFKPFVLVGGVVDDEIHHDADIALARFLDKPFMSAIVP
jgi:hypothetical protein